MEKIDRALRRYDIRGIYPDQIDEELAYRIGRALVRYLKCRRIAIGRDIRLSSDALFLGLAQGILDEGASVINLGLCSTDALYFATGFYEEIDAGVMITASHLPKEHNGFKIVKRDAVPVERGTGLNEIREMAKGKYRRRPLKGYRYKICYKSIMDDFIERALSFIDVKRVKPLRVVVDAGNGMAGKVIREIERYLPCKFIEMNFKLDGTFPAHPPDPLEPRSIEGLRGRVRDEGADFGVAFDADGDRMLSVEEGGEIISGSVLTALIAKRLLLLKGNPGAKILYNLVCSRVVPETIEACGGTPIMTPVGHSIIKGLMRKYDALFAGEHSYHFYFKDFFYADSGLIAMLLLLELISEEGKKLSEIVGPLRRYSISPEVNVDFPSREAALKRLEEVREEVEKKFPMGKVIHLEGAEHDLKVEFEDWWLCIRPSGTEPKLRLMVEAKTEEMMEQKIEELSKLVKRKGGETHESPIGQVR